MSAKVTSRRARRVRYHLSVAGWLFLGVSALVGLAAIINRGAPLMFVLFGVMMGTLYVSAVLARRVVSGVQVRREVPARVWQHRSVPLVYDLRNTRKRVHCLGLQVDEISPEGIESASGYCVHLPPGTTFRSGGRFAARCRGRISFRGVTLSTRFPFGLVVAGRTFEDPASVVVWPARGALNAQLLRRGAVEVSSSAPSGARGGQDEFFGLRDYRPDDNPRWIHWRRSAGRAVPVVREMSRAIPDILWVILDTHHPDTSAASTAAADRREKMLRFAATLIDRAFARGYQVAMALARESGPVVFTPRAGRGQRTRLLDALADVDANPTHRLTATIGSIERAMLKNSQVFVLSPEASSPDEQAVASLGGAGRHVEVVSGDRLDAFFADAPVGQEDASCR